LLEPCLEGKFLLSGLLDYYLILRNRSKLRTRCGARAKHWKRKQQ